MNTRLAQKIEPSIDLTAFCQEIRERALTGEFDNQAYVSPDIIERLKQLGVYRAFVPKRFGGDELSPREFCELIEQLSKADGSVGWVASFGMGPTYLGSLPEATFAKIFKTDPDTVFAGGIFPPQPAEIKDGGVEVRGRWKFSSGCMGADVVGVGITPQQGADNKGLPKMAVMPAKQARVEMCWDTVGLKGTGSHDLVVEGVIVPNDWTFVRGEPSQLPEPFFKYPSLSLATQVLVVVGIGVASASLEAFAQLAPGKASITGGNEIANRPVTQYEYAQAAAEFKSARAWFYQAMDVVWQEIINGRTPTREQISDMRLSSTHAARVAAEVARKMQLLAGMTAIYTNNIFARCVNDTHVVTQHAFMGDATLQNAGAISFGLNPTPGYL